MGRQIVNRVCWVRLNERLPPRCLERGGDGLVRKIDRRRCPAVFLQRIAVRAHIPGRSGSQGEIGAFAQVRDEILDWFAVTLRCRLRVRCLLASQPFEHPLLKGEIFQWFVARSLQNLVEQAAGLRGRKCSVERGSLRLFELDAKLYRLTSIGLLGGFLEPSSVAGAVGAKPKRGARAFENARHE